MRPGMTGEKLLRYRNLGNTGLAVSAIGYGASPLGDVFGAVDPATGRAAVQHAIDSGINLFDVSPYYGLTLAEERLGWALGDRRNEILLATKCGRYGSVHFDFSAATITREFEASLRRLRTDRVDLLQVHDIEFGNIDQIANETLPAMRRLQQQGKTRFIGITGYWPGLLVRLARQAPVDTVLNYCHANLLMDDMDRELTPFAQDNALGLLNASPLHMGLLGGRIVPEWHPATSAVKEVAAQVSALCLRHGVSPGTLALQHCLQHPVVASTFTGFKSASEVDDAIEALTFVPPPELIAELKRIIDPIMNDAWPSGLPENQPAGPIERSHAC